MELGVKCNNKVNQGYQGKQTDYGIRCGISKTLCQTKVRKNKNRNENMMACQNISKYVTATYCLISIIDSNCVVSCVGHCQNQHIFHDTHRGCISVILVTVEVH